MMGEILSGVREEMEDEETDVDGRLQAAISAGNPQRRQEGAHSKETCAQRRMCAIEMAMAETTHGNPRHNQRHLAQSR